jgi:hypothetical protein
VPEPPTFILILAGLSTWAIFAGARSLLHPVEPGEPPGLLARETDDECTIRLAMTSRLFRTSIVLGASPGPLSSAGLLPLRPFDEPIGLTRTRDQAEPAGESVQVGMTHPLQDLIPLLQAARRNLGVQLPESLGQPTPLPTTHRPFFLSPRFAACLTPQRSVKHKSEVC